MLDGGANWACATWNTATLYCWGGSIVTSPNLKEFAAPPFGGHDLGGAPVLLAAGDFHACAVLESGSTVCFTVWQGAGGWGELGDGTTVDPGPFVPKQVELDYPPVLLGLGGGFSCAVLGSNITQCWGMNEYGQLGDDTTESKSTPTTVKHMEGARRSSSQLVRTTRALCLIRASQNAGVGTTMDRSLKAETACTSVRPPWTWAARQSSSPPAASLHAPSSSQTRRSAGGSMVLAKSAWD